MTEALGIAPAGDTSKEKKGTLHVKELGFTQIDGHPEDHTFVVDVIFVHGLQGHPQETWQSKSKAESSTRPRKRRRTFFSNDSEVVAHDDTKPFWLADILPQDHKDARILTFGYDSKVTKGFMSSTSKNGIFQHGNSFLRAVGRVRTGCRQRPIVFVAHSLGGLVVKQALIEARKQTDEADLLDVYDSTHAIIFFGTPHRGSDLASWGLLLSTIAEAVQLDANNAILRDLDPTSGSSKLEEMRLDFDDILRDSHRAIELRVYSFQEEEGMTGIRSFGSKVVPDESSSLDSRKYGNDTIHANHMNMCRFSTKDDDGYEKFSGTLAKYINDIKTAQHETGKLNKDDILNSLDFAERRSREHQLQNTEARDETFSWIWGSSSLMGWLSSQGGVYWISGKPGSGKSTLVQYLVDDHRTKAQLQQHNNRDWIILHFFFDFRGGKGINNSFEGLLRSLLYQLIKKMPQLDALGIDDSKHDSFSRWPEHMLRDALRTSLKNTGKGVCVFVDGLDEYEGSILQVIQFLVRLATSNDSKNNSTKICISSRPEPVPSQFLQHLPNLSMSDHNVSGIRSYCFSTLEGLEPVVREDMDISRLSDVVAERAEGVFLWARFASEELIRGHCEGEDTDELMIRLERIPRSLEEVYDRMLGRVEPSAKKECLIMLQLVGLAKRDLSWQELFVATKVAMDKDVVMSERMCGYEGSTNALKLYTAFTRRLRAKAVGLVELVRIPGTNPRRGTLIITKLIHRSVSTYLNQKGWRTLGESEGDNSVAHESFYVETCIRYLHGLLHHCKLERVSDQRLWRRWFLRKIFHDVQPMRAQFSRTLDSGMYPFFAYAALNIFEHARSLERHGASSYPLLHNSLTEQLIFVHFHLNASSQSQDECHSCSRVPYEGFFEDLNVTCVAILHRLVLYCKNDLAVRTSAPGQKFWERALSCAILSSQRSSGEPEVQQAVSLALEHIITVQQLHLEQALWYCSMVPLKLVIQHESVKDLRPIDNNGQAVTILWLFANDNRVPWDEHLRLFTKDNRDEHLRLLIEAANRRGEDVRLRCGPKGNLAQTLKKSRRINRDADIRALRNYYISMSWDYEYDSDSIQIGEVKSDETD